MTIGRFVGVLGAFVAVASRVFSLVKRRHDRARALPLELADLTEVASIPPPAPSPRHHPRVPSLVRPDVHAFELAGPPAAVPSRPGELASGR